MRFTSTCPISFEQLDVQNACLTRSRPSVDQPYFYCFYSFETLLNLQQWSDPFTRNQDFNWVSLQDLPTQAIENLIERQITRRLAELKSHASLANPPSDWLDNLPWQDIQPRFRLNPNRSVNLFPASRLRITALNSETTSATVTDLSQLPSLDNYLTWFSRPTN